MSGKKPKALILLSGGLDSRLACKLLEDQLGKRGVEAVFFKIPFGGGCGSSKALVEGFCRKHGYRLHIRDLTQGQGFRRYMAMIKRPRFQTGVGMNPCIDCHLFMLKEAKKLAKETGADFLATGEVLGERPLSQNRQALGLIEKRAGLSGRLLRPLSARLLPETLAEKRGLVDRTRLLDIQGRQRKRQISLARGYRISYPSPGGGCLLAERGFSRRLRNLLVLKGAIKPDYIELLKLGRHFLSFSSPQQKLRSKRELTASKGTIIIVGRREQENKGLLKIARRQGIPYMEARDFMGPVTLILGRAGRDVIKDAAGLTVRYSDCQGRGKVELEYRKGKVRKTLKAGPISKRGLEGMRA